MAAVTPTCCTTCDGDISGQKDESDVVLLRLRVELLVRVGGGGGYGLAILLRREIYVLRS